MNKQHGCHCAAPYRCTYTTADNKIQISLQSINLTGKKLSSRNGHPQYEAIETQASVKMSTTLWPEYQGLRGRSKEMSTTFFQYRSLLKNTKATIYFLTNVTHMQ